MPSFRYFTVADALTHLQDFAGSVQKASEQRRRRLAIAAAYQHLSSLRRWRYYTKYDRLQVNAAFTSGTVSYDHSGGAFERLVTLAGGTWPSWAGRGTLLLANVEYEVESRVDNTRLTLTETSNPGADVGASAYSLHNDRFLLPLDFLGVDQLYGQMDRQRILWADPLDLLGSRRLEKLTGRPGHYTVVGDCDELGRLSLRLSPLPDAALPLDFTYVRRARPLLFDRYAFGTLTTDGSTTVSGSGTSFTDAMEGSILRVSFAGAELVESSAELEPQWFEAMAMPPPYVYERRVTAVTSATLLSVDATIPALASVRYEISDPVDVEPGTMFTAFLRCAEWQLGCLMRWEDRDALYTQYQNALQAAIDVDRRYNLRDPVEQESAEVERRSNTSVASAR
jgi:hypothetical protein